MDDLSIPRNMTSHDMLEEYRREYNRGIESLLLPYTTEQGVVKIKEWKLPSTIDILMEMQSSGTLSDVLSDSVKNFIDEEDSSISIPIIQKSAIETPATNPSETLPNVVGQDEIRPSQAKFVHPNPPRKSTETISSTSMLRSNKAKIKKPVVTVTPGL